MSLLNILMGDHLISAGTEQPEACMPDYPRLVNDKKLNNYEFVQYLDEWPFISTT